MAPRTHRAANSVHGLSINFPTVSFTWITAFYPRRITVNEDANIKITDIGQQSGQFMAVITGSPGTVGDHGCRWFVSIEEHLDFFKKLPHRQGNGIRDMPLKKRGLGPGIDKYGPALIKYRFGRFNIVDFCRNRILIPFRFCRNHTGGCVPVSENGDPCRRKKIDHQGGGNRNPQKSQKLLKDVSKRHRSILLSLKTGYRYPSNNKLSRI